MSQLSGRIAGLSPAKRELLLQKLNQKKDNTGVSIRPLSRETNTFPLSFAQQRLWFIDQLDPGNPTYQIPAIVRLTGKLDVAALEQSFNALVQRHEILRTTFITIDGQPVQNIAPTLKLTIPVTDLQSHPEPEQEVQRLAIVEAQTSFDLAQAPLLRVQLLHLNSSAYVLLFTLHHIICDGWSMGIFLQELASLYQAIVTRKPASLPDLPIQYADFAAWQQQWLQGEVLETHLDYWKQQLSGELPILNLPTDRPRSAVQTYRGGVVNFVLPQPLIAALTQLSQQQGATLFMTLLAAFKVLLYCYTGQEDILVGSAIANRNRAETESLIGLFANTLVLRSDLSRNPTFRELLQRVRTATLGAYNHQDLPFEKLVETLQPERDLSRNPLFQVLFALRNIQMPTLELPELMLSSQDLERTTSRFDLSLNLWESPEGLSGAFEYSQDLFDVGTVPRMVGHFQTLLEGIVADPDRSIVTLPLLTQSEQQQLVEWNPPSIKNLPKHCLHHLFEAQAAKSPEAIAVVYENQQLTYRELNTRANQLARHLQKLGVAPDVLVGICVERSLEMLIGLLGILKAGGAYVPLDPSYPQARLTFMLEDSHIPVLVTQHNLLEKLQPQAAQVVCLDTDWETIAIASQENLDSGVTDRHLAYTIYTSGSTGKPKGVQIEHRALTNFLHSMRQEPGLTADDVLLAVTTISFDIAALELYLPLIVGARVVLVSRDVASNAAQLSRTLQQSNVTVMQATPATWQLLLAAGWQGDRRLKLLCGGEALPRELANQLLKRCQSLWNMYGPTETTIWSAIHPVEPGDGSVVVGRAIANTQIYILNQHSHRDRNVFNPVPVGVPGEVYIGGEGLARGYLNRPDLTAERFISFQIDNSKSIRLYRAGDLGRYRSDGTIEVIERIDHQVKIRGFRIELGEIETVLEQHPEIKQAVVIAREDNPGNQRLVAYVVPTSVVECQATPLIPNLRCFLKAKLPHYMVPAAFVLLDVLPLNANGKLDRRALPAPNISSDLESNFVAPRTAIEATIADIWTEVLNLSQPPSVQANFFELGGHSLLATQVVSRLRTTFQVELPLRRLFEAPTIADLAIAISDIAQSSEAPIERVSQSADLPLSFAQERLWFLDQLKPGDPAYNIPAAVRLQGVLNVTALEQSLNTIVQRHAVLRTSFVIRGGQPIQAIAETVSLPLPIVDLQNLKGTEQEQRIQQLAMQEAQTSFDLAQAPLLRVTLLQLGETEYVVLFTMHHIISDRWSMGVLIRELTTLYSAYCTGKSIVLPELPIQYSDFAVWQRQHLQGEVLDQQLSYWQQQLGGKLPVLRLQTEQSSGQSACSTGQSETHSFVLSPTVSEALNRLSRETGATLFMTLLAALKTLLYRYTGQEDVVVGTDVANRNRAETEALIGFFINILVLRTSLQGNPSFRELLDRVREVALGAYAHQDLPFSKIVEHLQPERHLNQTPLFQVLFVLQNAPMPPLELPGLTLTPLEAENHASKFDLVLFMVETPEGLAGTWKYNREFCDQATLTRFSKHFETLLDSIVTQPDSRLNTLEMLTETEKIAKMAEQKQREASNRQKFNFVKPKAVSLPTTEFVKTEELQPGQSLPLLVQPNVGELDLVDWAKSNRAWIETQLFKHGGLLFRGFNTHCVQDFENFAQAICPELFGEYGDLPREGVGGKVYSSTPYPADKAILFHNESSHMHRYPLKIWFFCVQPAQQGGETPIVDCRKLYQLLNPKLREKFAQQQLMYVRNYTDGLDVSWQDFFHTSDRAVVEQYCHQHGIEFEWTDHGLRTREVRQAIAQHPKTGDWVFFNQIQLHHIAYLDRSVRDSLLALFGEANLPRHVYYGDATPIEDSVIEEISALYQQATIAFPWQAGDVLMLDNMLTAHGRNPYVGPRKIVVAMGELISNPSIALSKTAV
ncbi:MAG: amino acid adenylation domain-containing protein [Myxacorys californica WJT36-NPBG1]|jgi:amino acid adenylation domain-containing protein|nr:amino acid adenylation domain-containing protein [Myxacorys californica WJT36-NPBG1]